MDQFVTVLCVTSLVGILTLFFFFFFITRHFRSKKQKNKEEKQKPDEKPVDYWNEQHKHSDVEWFADWIVLRSYLEPWLSHRLPNYQKLNILIVGNGTSSIPLSMIKEFNENIQSINITDVSMVALETTQKRFNAELLQSSDFLRPNETLVHRCHYQIFDVIDPNSDFVFKKHHCNHLKFDLVFDKGVSDTFQYRRNTKQSLILLRRMFTNIRKLMANKDISIANDDDNDNDDEVCLPVYIICSPRKKIPLLNLEHWKWSVIRTKVIMKKENNIAHLSSLTTENTDTRSNRNEHSVELSNLWLHYCRALSIDEGKSRKIKMITNVMNLLKKDNSTTDQNSVEYWESCIIRDIRRPINDKKKKTVELIIQKIRKNNDDETQTVLFDRSMICQIDNLVLRTQYCVLLILQPGDVIDLVLQFSNDDHSYHGFLCTLSLSFL